MPPIEKQPLMELTEFGWALVSETKPARGETNVWLKIPERHIYLWDGEGFWRAKPPELNFQPINHG